MAVEIASLIHVLGGSSLLSSSSASGGQLVFMDMAKKTPYKDVLTVNTTHEVYIMKARLHRFLLVKMKGSSYPWITFEINTPNLTDLTTLMQEIEDLPLNNEKVGDYEGKLLTVCVIADSVVERMENYHLFSNNCQHFCNNLLLELGLQTYETTVGPRTTLEPEFNPDTHTRAWGLDHAYNSAMGYTPAIVASAAAAVIGFIVGVPSTRSRECHTQ